ncbi:MAG: DUF2138 family protein [Pseudomarimonas sp.]
MSSTEATPSSPPVATRRGRKLALTLGLLLPLATAGYFGWRALQVPVTTAVDAGAEYSALQLDLGKPDALIQTRSLSTLPRDLLQVPLLRDLLTEDFVFYYEHHADRLGLTGSLRRIAYEHDLEWRDTLIRELLDAPAEVALWRGGDGKLRHSLIRIELGEMAGMLPSLAAAASNDSQLSQVGELQGKRSALPLYRLRYNSQRAVLFAIDDKQLLLVGSAGMLQSTAAENSPIGRVQAGQLQAMLAGKQAISERFGLPEKFATHRLTVSADYLTMGYGHFVPQLAGLRLDMDDHGWRSFVALNAVPDSAMQFQPLWLAMPMGASACVAVPVSAKHLQSLTKRLGGGNTLPAGLQTAFAGPAALCWYPQSRLHTPLLVTQLADDPAAPSRADRNDRDRFDKDLGSAFDAMIGAFEPNVDDGRLPVTTTIDAEASRWQRVVGSTWGLHATSDLQPAVALSSDRYFRVSLARQGKTLLFSLDEQLVEQALSTLQKRFPPLAEQLPDTRVPLYLAPKSLAQLLEQETLRSLPADVEAVFRNAAEAHLLPKLRAMGEQPPYAVSLPAEPDADSNWTWLPLQWTAL